MVPLTALWLPIVVSAIFVFIASMILHAGLPFWHRRDYRPTGNEAPFVEASRSLEPGFYSFPSVQWNKMTAEEQEEWRRGPVGFMYLRKAASISMGRTFVLHFLYCLVGSFLAAYVATIAAGRGAEYLHVHRAAGTAGMLFWAFGTNFSDAIWYGKPWTAAFKSLIDGVIYGFLIGGTFGWLWPG
ncbi:MAG TPA: hypothetical protein VND45_04550 [Thermoanaerobaculia bacterium]|nr:hypothetical protein [Thermoanaerobaculia bacterium]